MNKKILALSVATALSAGATVANAQSTAQTGTSLVVPYYTVQNGNATLINIVNTDTSRGKAVKVRFRGAQRSDDVFDFQLFLSPGDVWAASVSQAADGRAQLSTADNSCTLPANVNEPFVTARLSGTDAEKAAGTREGYVEIINMGDIITAAQAVAEFTIGAGVTDPNAVARGELYTATKHVNGVAPCSTSALMRIVNRTVDNDNSITGAESRLPTGGRLSGVATGGLMANVTVINVNEAAAWSFDAVAAQTVSLLSSYWSQTGVAYGGTNAELHAVTLDGIFLSRATAPAQFDFPDLSTPRLAGGNPLTQYGAVNTAITTRASLLNEFITDDSIFAETDWVLSLPTRRYAIEGRNVVWPISAQIPAAQPAPYGGGNVGGNVFLEANPTNYGTDTELAAANATTFYINSYLNPFRPLYTAANNCLTVGGFSIFDREEQTTTTGVVISPGEVAQLRLCGEVGVVSFNNNGATTSGALGAELTLNDATIPYADGWAAITFGQALPVIGNAFVKANNGGSGAANMNFGGVWKHR